MVDLELELDEGIVLQTTEVERYGIKELSLDEMVLTNKNIVCVYEKSTGLFSKPETIIEKIPLSTIKVANGQAQVMIHDSDEYGKGLQVLFISGHRERFIFSDSPKKTMPLWINEINKILVGEPVMPIQIENTQPTYSSESKPKKSFLGGLAGALGSLDIQSVMDKAQEKIGQFANQIQGEISQSQQQKVDYSEPQVQPQEQPSISRQPQVQTVQVPNETVTNENVGKMLFCSNCGTRLNEGSKFCHGCGVAVGTVQKETSSVPPQEQKQPQEEYSKERQQEYVGKIYKCPNCGNNVNLSDAICEACGFHLSGKKAIVSATDFQQQLLKVEMTRQSKKIGFWDQREALDATDKQTIALIKSYPIPNTIEDIVEFMHLAIANIDVNKSKKSVFNTDGWDGGSREREISNAWVGKLQSIYTKAELYFPNEPEFAHIKEAYETMMKKLKKE